MNINVSSGSGYASTLLSAFDAALKDAGVYNYNLIPLSSVIPPATQVNEVEYVETPPEEYGHKLYCVIAHESSNETNKYIAAGIGWYQLEDGRGVFVEHHLTGETEVAVDSEMKHRIENSLRDLCLFRNFEFKVENVMYRMEIAQVTDNPACVLVIAAYESEGWN